jgi:hypothetical protein
MIGPLLLMLGMALAIHNVQPPLATVKEIAAYTKCDPARIAGYTASIGYRKEPTWPTSEMVLATRKADCKGHAVLTRDILLECGYEASVIIAKGYKAATPHAFAVYLKPDGRRGYINFHQQDEFKAGTTWDEVIQAVEGGPWRVYER